MYLSFNHNLKVMKNTTYTEKGIEFDTVTHILTITKGYFSLYDEKIAFCLKRGVLLSLKIPPSAACMRQWIGTALFQIMACRLCGTEPLSKPMLGYCQLEEQTSVKF